jgi:TatA/E family protein of Tat protein translocase
VILGEILGPELLIVLAIVALLFGSTKLPKLARSLGSTKSEFERGLREGATSDPDPSGSAAHGAAESVKGKVKETAGAITGRDELRREGIAQQDKGEAQRRAALHEAEADRARHEADVHEAEQHRHQD